MRLISLNLIIHPPPTHYLLSVHYSEEYHSVNAVYIVYHRPLSYSSISLFFQANEINELVGKAFKTSFTKKSLRRHKQNVKDTPWKVVTPQAPPPQLTVTNDRPLPSAPLPSAPPPDFAPPLDFPPPRSPLAYNVDHLLIEAGLLEADIGRMRARIAEIDTQIRAVSGVEDAVIQLTVQLSTIHQQVELKTRRLAVVQQEIQATEAATSLPSYEGLYPTIPTVELAGISLEDADWFQEGLPR